MNKPTLHLLGIFHTIPSLEFSHCAFTGRVLRFAKMMRPYGWHVIEYSNQGSESEANEHVVMLDRCEFDLLEHYPKTKGNMNTKIYKLFNRRLKEEIVKRAKPGDIICHPFGIAHQELGQLLPDCYHVEIGVGYNQCAFDFRVYESYAWWHYHQGKEQKPGGDYQWVCPMGYDISEWPTVEKPDNYLLYFGRIVEDKGMRIIQELAKALPWEEFLICGEGDPTPWISKDIPNLTYQPPVYGKNRAAWLGRAKALLMPTRYTEPFGGAGVEGLLCGTPLLSSDYGAFSETVIHGQNGYRNKTLGDWITSIHNLDQLEMPRFQISMVAKSIYGLDNVGKQMGSIFNQISDLSYEGWYELNSNNAIWSLT